jgi:hypothetical protein
MNEIQRQQLVDLGAGALADALLELAQRDTFANDLVDRLVALPTENLQRFNAKLAALKHPRHFISYRESAGFARELEEALQDLRSGVEDPRIGIELMVAFYEMDEAIGDNCDDSNGVVAQVFRYDAKELFTKYASRCEDKDWLVEQLLRLLEKNEYGLRDSLDDNVAEYLPEPNLRTMISRCQKLAENESDDYKKRRWNSCIRSLARQIKDAPLFEKILVGNLQEVPPAFCIDIAKVYLECGDARMALSLVKRIPEESTAHGYASDRLLLDIYGQLGDSEEQAKIAWKIFRIHREVRFLDELLSVIGKDKKDAVIASEAAAILTEKKLSLMDAIFLVELGHIDEAESYLLDRFDQLNGDFYGEVLPLAESMEKNGRALVASILYRALLNPILIFSHARAYHHGASYLRKLDKLAVIIPD